MLELAHTLGALFREIAHMVEFNRLLLGRGWIAHGWLNSDAARLAVDAASRGDWQAADVALVEAYDPAAVRYHLMHNLAKIRCFKPRSHIARLALEDYEAERFHACVPVALSVLDGMGKDELGQPVLRHGVQLARVPSSFLEVGPGLTHLLRLFCGSRNRTSNDSIDIPYRHGIVHGVDLGYANKVVAAKVWGAVIAFGHFVQARADAVEAAKLPPPPDVSESLREAAERKQYWAGLNDQLDSWTPRDSDQVLASIAAGTLHSDTPEAAVLNILDAWASNKVGKIALWAVNWRNEDTNHFAGQIKENLRVSGTEERVPPPDYYRIVATRDVTIAHTVVTVCLSWTDVTEMQIDLRLSYFLGDQNYPRVAPGGKWLVVQLWPLESAAMSYVISKQKRGDEDE